MIALNDVLVVLEDDLDKCSEVSLHNRCVLVYATTSGSVRYTSHAENARDFEEIGELQRSVRGNIRYTVNCVSLFAVHLTSWTRKYDSSACIYQTVMVGSLWVWPWTASCQVSPATMWHQVQRECTVRITVCLFLQHLCSSSEYEVVTWNNPKSGW